jgi:plastocyanin
MECPIAAETRDEVSMKSHKTIRIKENEGIIPQTVTVRPGGTVTWVNLSLSEVEIFFLDKKVVNVADYPLHFFIGRENTYESRKICAGCTASLCFQERGTFEYLVKEFRNYHGNEKEFRGAMMIK